MKLKLNTAIATSICLSGAGITALGDEVLMVTTSNPITEDLPDEIAQAVLDSSHGHAFEVVKEAQAAKPSKKSETIN